MTQQDDIYEARRLADVWRLEALRLEDAQRLADIVLGVTHTVSAIGGTPYRAAALAQELRDVLGVASVEAQQRSEERRTWASPEAVHERAVAAMRERALDTVAGELGAIAPGTLEGLGDAEALAALEAGRDRVGAGVTALEVIAEQREQFTAEDAPLELGWCRCEEWTPGSSDNVLEDGTCRTCGRPVQYVRAFKNDGEWLHVADTDEELREKIGEEVGGGPQCDNCGSFNEDEPEQPGAGFELREVDGRYLAVCGCCGTHRQVRWMPAPGVTF